MAGKRLRTLMEQFAALDGAAVSCGPRHPTDPDQSIAGDVRDFLRRHSFLKADPGYVKFLQVYGGACILRPDGNGLDISGFHEGMGLMLEDDGPPVYNDGWFTFSVAADIVEGRPVYGQFDFRVEPWAVYFRPAEGHLREPALCGTFEEWLAEVVSVSGRLVGWVTEPPTAVDVESQEPTQ